LSRLVWCALLLAAVPARAAERWHTVAAGESVSAIAEHYYGDFSHTDLLLRFNARRDADVRPGERLRIPFCVEHRVAAGDNGSTLARRFLGRGSAWNAIATLNGLVPEAPLRPGQTLEMPVVLRHAVVRGDSLSDLAATYLGDARLGAMLRTFNGIDDPRDLPIGRVVEIPIIGLRLSQPETPRVAQRKPEPAAAPEPPPWLAGDLAAAEGAFERGDYAGAETRVASLLERIDAIPDAAGRASVWRLSAFVEIAFDRGQQACAAYAAMRATGAPVNLEPDRVSPKIRDAFAACAAR